MHLGKNGMPVQAIETDSVDLAREYADDLTDVFCEVIEIAYKSGKQGGKYPTVVQKDSC